MAKEFSARTFKSGNSVALRLPKGLGIEEGREMMVREEQGRYIVEPAGEPRRIDLTGVWGSCPGLQPIRRGSMAPRKLDWEGKMRKRG